MIRVAKVQPERSVGAQHAADLVEDRRKVVDEEVRVRFEAQLTEPDLATGAGLGRRKIDGCTGLAGSNRPGVLHIGR